MGRRPCCSKDEGLNRGAWTAIEDKILTDYIKVHGEGRWRSLPLKAGLKRCGKSCRLRWLNYLRPDIKRGNISKDEEELIIRLHKLLGNRWSLIAGRLPGRTDNEIKNYWNTNLGKKVQDRQASSETRKNSSNIADITSKSSKLDPPLIRTKATKCSRVVVNLDPAQLQPFHMETTPLSDQKDNDSYRPNNIGPLIVASNNDDDREDNIDFNSSHGEDLMMDLSIGKVYLSELLNTELPDLWDDFNIATDHDRTNSEDLSPCSSNLQPPLMLSEGGLEDWNLVRPLPFTNSVLDSVGDWLCE